PLAHTRSYLFSLQRRPSLPALHSFPTRRSSDLLRRNGRVSQTLIHEARRAAPASDQPLWKDCSCCVGLLSFSCSRSSRAPSAPVDRKSTRLNSSHVSISYAVFCLKKKN